MVGIGSATNTTQPVLGTLAHDGSEAQVKVQATAAPISFGRWVTGGHQVWVTLPAPRPKIHICTYYIPYTMPVATALNPHLYSLCSLSAHN